MQMFFLVDAVVDFVGDMGQEMTRQVVGGKSKKKSEKSGSSNCKKINVYVNHHYHIKADEYHNHRHYKK